MKSLTTFKSALQNDGFVIVPEIYTPQETASLLSLIDSAKGHTSNFKISGELFAIRQFLKEIPEAVSLIFNDRLNTLITELFGTDFFVIKSIYFDKPEHSNWFVPYHQDLTISVDKKMELPTYERWTVKQDQFAVQPPLSILQSIYTIRIHLDDTTQHNGALKVIPGSHHKGIYRPETIDWTTETETTCNVESGGIMIMRPLLLHSSGRTTNQQKRRVIHIEFSNQDLAKGIEWAEFLNINFPEIR